MSVPLAAASTSPQPGLLDLERELICSICTETLYQPLTLIDCLHTFCGSCLKEWFTFEYNKVRSSSSSSSSSRSNTYTCPTCRAPVKDARHNATVTTLLEMFLAANPERRKSEADKADIAKSYEPGENILPKVEHGGGRRSRRREVEDRAEEEAERRQLEEARERSIRETRGTAAQLGTRLAAPASEGTSSRSRSRESREQRRRDDERREERRERRRRAEAAEAQLREREATSSTAATAPVADLTTENLAAARLSPPTTSPRHPAAVEARHRERRIVPQTSLRSLMSSSESGAGTGDSLEAEQILQQIIDDGLLEGFDLHNLSPAQEDALSERIAEAYRQRQRQRGDQSSQLSPRDATRRISGRISDRTRVRERQQEAERRHHQRSHSAHGSSTTESRRVHVSEDRRPPASRARFQDADFASTAQRRRASENERRRTSPPTTRSDRTNPEDVVRNATRSATDLSDRPQASDEARANRPRHPSDTRRTSTEPEHVPGVSERRQRVAQGDNARSSTSDLSSSKRNGPLSSEAGTIPTSATVTTSPRSRDAFAATGSPLISHGNPSQFTAVPPQTASHAAPRAKPDLPPRSAPHPSAPSISCANCSRPSIQYDLHKHCSQCSSNICLRCYRTVPSSILGCRTDSIAESAPNVSAPTSPSEKMQAHAFSSRKYLRPDDTEQFVQNKSPKPAVKNLLSSDPASRLQEGKFCDLCQSFANICYWSCDTCNKGDWGFCNACINSHHCCTHPLLPLAHKSYAPKTPTLQQGPNPDSGVITLTPSTLHADVLPTTTSTSITRASSKSRPSTSNSSTPASTAKDPDYLTLTFTTHCDICSYPIPPSHTRFHCPSHPSSPTNPTNPSKFPSIGDYDICTTCYTSLIKQRKLRREDGPNGWRKCPQGHRMIVIGFEDAPEGQKRIVVNDLVGGHSLRDADIAAAGNAPSAAVKSGQWSWVEDVEGATGTVTKRDSRASRIRYSNTSTSSSSGGAGTGSGNSKFPPDGGHGMRAVAGYPWFPEEGESGAGELMFPRWAEIREAEDVNGEWWAGVYAGFQGVFPGVCVRAI
ncbi:hypothetical protein EPUS_05234 [Endocarpon pusillum Z07020]|uniref:RING-type domain-containing protein n=1 Tax=Endocarpon pusillum (strain Z07020 / HMAS-L-300199) TaxID=1263415 RepID=U1HJK0_ENDPU|nr:uncharacterized protein EPUS_05234 [Endocarpon pusillum Z07020]ERF70415.1 hypothetical protein EPUS_05234 [Endocarpon pusillum Z07020]